MRVLVKLVGYCTNDSCNSDGVCVSDGEICPYLVLVAINRRAER